MVDTIINSFDIWTNAQGIKSRTRIKSVDNISLEGIARLRELILDLAIQGKLVPQDSTDETASKLLDRISLERKNLIKTGKVKSQKKIPEINENEKYFILPNTWEWARLIEIGNIFNGNSVNSSVKASKYEGLKEGYPYIATKDVGYGFELINYDNGVKIPFDEPKFKTARKGTVLICSEGGSAGKKTGITEQDVCFGNKLYALEQYGDIESLFILSFYGSQHFKRSFTEKMTGIIGGISVSKFCYITIPVPPLEEQKRIVAKVDELMALCDKLEEEKTNNLKTHEVLVKTILETLTQAKDIKELQEAWERMSTHFDTLFCTEDSIEQLKQTILQLGVMGKLVKQDPTDEPASGLLKKIAAEKIKLIKDGEIKKQKPLPEITEGEQPFELPESWEWVPWSNILAYDDYAFKRGPFGSSLKKDMFVEKGYKVYEQYCPINDDCSFERYYITDELFKKLEGFAVKADDYLVSCSGATLGRITQVPKNFKEGIINQALLRVRINHKYVDKDFFKLLFRSPYFQIMIRDNSTGSAIPNVKGVKELKAMAIPFFHINEQRKIVKKIETLYSICDSLKNRIINSQKIKGNLSRTIIENAVQ